MAFEFFDDSAFYWFLNTLLGLALVPYTVWWYLGPAISKSFGFLFKGKEEDTVDYSCQCSRCKAKERRVAAEQFRARWTWWHITKWVLFISMWTLFLGLSYNLLVYHSQEFVTFDPYELLGIEVGSAEKVIKKAYRDLSLKWHPDKNPGDAEAEQKFILIAKAYQTLTDEATRENYEKYGNPDGFQGHSVTIGLPSFLTRRENELSILLVYFVVMVVFVGAVAFWWNKSSKYDKHGILVGTLGNCLRQVTATSSVEDYAEVMANSVEFFDFGQKPPAVGLDEFAIAGKAVMSHRVQKLSKPNYFFCVKKAWTLLMTYLLREDVPLALEEERRLVVKTVPRVADALFETLANVNLWRDKLRQRQAQIVQKRQKQMSEKEMEVFKKQYFNMAVPLKPIQSLIEFKQYVSQGLWVNDHELEQVPFITREIIRDLKRSGVSTLLKLKHMSSDDRFHVLSESKHFDLSCLEDVEAMLHSVPSVELQYFVESKNEEMEQSEMVSVTLKLNRLEQEELELKPRKKAKRSKVIQEKLRAQEEAESSSDSESESEDEVDSDDDLPTVQKKSAIAEFNSGDAELASASHCPRFPYAKKERWFIMLYDRTNNRVVGVKHVPVLGNFQEMEIKVPLMGRKRLNMEAYAYCDSLIGVDQKLCFDFKVGDGKKSKQVQKEEEPAHEDDEKDLLDDDEDEIEIIGFWDYVFFAVLAWLMYLVIPGTYLGKRYVMPYVDMVLQYSQENIYDFGRVAPENLWDPTQEPKKRQRGKRIPRLQETQFEDLDLDDDEHSTTTKPTTESEKS